MAALSSGNVALFVNEDEEPPGRSPCPGLSQIEPTAGVLPAERDAPTAVARPSRRPRGSGRARAFRKAFFPDARQSDWDDWQWQIRNRIQTLDALERILALTPEEQGVFAQGGAMLPFAITPHYASLIYTSLPDQPLRRSVVPTLHELVRSPGEADDPLGEDGHSPVPGLVHRYPDRVLLLVTGFCSSYCRYCTRSRVVGHGRAGPGDGHLRAALDYIRRTPQVRDVLISGGDPLTLSDEYLDWLLSEVRHIPHVELVRLGTKVTTVLPQRVTPQLCRMLKRYHPLFVSLHFIHPDECTPETHEACWRLADAGIPLGSQTVLLRGVNDSVEVMKELMHKLLLMRVRPYYVYQCDPISGSAHFRTPVAKGLEIIQGLRGHTSGYAVPSFVIDAPGGGGKIPLQPNYVVGREGDNLLLRNYEGQIFRYPDPIE